MKTLFVTAMLFATSASMIGSAHAAKDLSIPAARKVLLDKLGTGWRLTNFEHAQRSWATPHANTKGFIFEAQKNSGPVRLKLGKMSPTGHVNFFKLNSSSPDE